MEVLLVRTDSKLAALGSRWSGCPRQHSLCFSAGLGEVVQQNNAAHGRRRARLWVALGLLVTP